MRSFNEYKENQSVSTFFGNLISYRAQAHILHLSTKSFSEHKSLEKFYNSLNELTDDLIETYQGQYGIVNISQGQIKSSQASELLKSIAQEVKEARDIFDKKDTHLYNILDEITSLTYSILYRINNLK
jgi:hypothetical protein